MKKYLFGLAITFSSLLLDLVTKSLVVNNINPSNPIDFFGGFLRITLVYNRGGVFGILQGYKNMFLIVSIVVLVIMIIFYILEKNKPYLFVFSMSLIMGGALGNIWDRLVPGRVGVVDFISIGVDKFYRWPAFNVADSVIVIGAFFLALLFIKEEKKKSSNKGNLNE